MRLSERLTIVPLRAASGALGLLAIGLAILPGGEPRAQSLKEAVEIALRSNPEPLQAQALLGAQVGVYDQARAALYPSVDLRFSTGKQTSDNFNTRAAGFNERRLSPDESSVTGQWPIFDGFQISSEVSRQGSLVGAAKYRLFDTWEQIALRTASTYLEVVRDQALIGLAQENVENHRRMLEKVTLRYKSGVGNLADVQQAEGRLAQARADLASQQGTLDDSIARYLRLVGKPPRGLQSPPSPEAMIPPALDAAIMRAYDTNPTVKVAETELDAAGSAVVRAKGTLMPRFDLELSYIRNNDQNGLPGPDSSTAGLVVMRYNLFRGGGDIAQVRENLDRETAALENLNNSRIIVRESVARAWAAMESAREALPELERHAKSAVEVVEAFQSQFVLGRRTLFDLLNAESESFRARSDAVIGQYGVAVSQYRVLAAMGGLVSALGIGIAPVVPETAERVVPLWGPQEPVQ
jgi:outer membrane protein, adhesin transport system